jgi:hypothetical protein
LIRNRTKPSPPLSVDFRTRSYASHERSPSGGRIWPGASTISEMSRTDSRIM